MQRDDLKKKEDLWRVLQPGGTTCVKIFRHKNSMIYAEEHISVWVLKDEIGGDQQKEEPEFFFSYMITWTNIRNWLKYLWIKFQPFQCGFIFLF